MTDRFFTDLAQFERQRVWREIRRDVWLMLACAGALGFLLGQVL